MPAPPAPAPAASHALPLPTHCPQSSPISHINPTMRTLALAALLAVALAGTLQPVAAGDDALDEAAAALEAKISDLDDFKSAAEDKLKAAAAEAADRVKHKACTDGWGGPRARGGGGGRPGRERGRGARGGRRPPGRGN